MGLRIKCLKDYVKKFDLHECSLALNIMFWTNNCPHSWFSKHCYKNNGISKTKYSITLAKEKFPYNESNVLKKFKRNSVNSIFWFFYSLLKYNEEKWNKIHFEIPGSTYRKCFVEKVTFLCFHFNKIASKTRLLQSILFWTLHHFVLYNIHRFNDNIMKKKRLRTIHSIGFIFCKEINS